jgi:pteridine reductase
VAVIAERLDGRVALVTGAGHRVGRAVAERLAEAGAGVVVHYGGSRSAAEETAGGLRDDHGVPAWALGADLADPAAIERLFAAVAERCGRLDVLVNSAAVFEPAPLESLDATAWDRVLAINLRAPHLCVREALGLLRAAAAERGATSAVVNVSDLSGVVAWRGFLHHGASKAGLLHWTRTAALELAPAVRVNAIVPGALLPPPGVDTDADSWREMGRRLPLGRTGSPRDAADAVLYLATAEFVTGAVLSVDGGEALLGSTKR